nr:phosphoglucosamine mutase [Oceanococcus sp. HetDA_MAG_MS8]
MGDSRRWFGTDGIRGRVGMAPMTPDFVLRLGWALGTVLRQEYGQAQVVIGKDTRLSGYMLESALEAGLSAAGARSLLLGPIPTPAVSLLTTTFRAQAGIVVSASHNPFGDNGIKIFGADGYKLADAREQHIEALLAADLQCADAAEFGKARRIDDAAGRYVEFCKSTFKADSLSGLKVVLDCANGAAYQVAPLILQELGAKLVTLGTQPDGTNINHNVGSTHPQALQRAVVEQQADVGIALDGDADRCLMVDAQGRLVDGDAILFILARARQQRDELQGPVVGTLMSNYGLEQALSGLGIPLLRAKVGDRYVFEQMLAHEAQLGGEPSGHVLVRDRCRTGDGMVTALQVLTEMQLAQRPLADLCQGLECLPQVLINVRCEGHPPAEVMAAPRVRQAVEAANTALEGQGRLLLRPSGTEPLIRVMTEAAQQELAQAQAEAVAEALQLVLN